MCSHLPVSSVSHERIDSHKNLKTCFYSREARIFRSSMLGSVNPQRSSVLKVDGILERFRGGGRKRNQIPLRDREF